MDKTIVIELKYSYLLFFIILAAGLLFAALIFIFKKISAKQKILEVYIERRTREIKLKNEELEKNNAIKTRLISIISHDVISPLKYIHVTAKILSDKKTPLEEELVNEMLYEIANTSKELELISTNILNWIKYQYENRRVKKEQFDLHEMIEQIFTIFNGLAKQRDVSFINQCKNDVVMYQYMEPVKIILYNLVLNALNFTEKGSITISGAQTTNRILIKVKDEGMGMTEEQIRNILSEDFIVSSQNIDRKKGNGLGYLIIKDLLKFINAKFSIRSKKNVGTIVSILIPNSK